MIDVFLKNKRCTMKKRLHNTNEYKFSLQIMLQVPSDLFLADEMAEIDSENDFVVK